MPVVVDVGLPRGRGLRPGGVGDLFLQVVAVLDRQLDFQEDPQRAKGCLCRTKFAELVLADLHDVAVAVDQLHPAQFGGEAAQVFAGSVRAGGQGPCDLLLVDVALVAERQSLVPQRVPEGVDGGAGQGPGAAPHPVGAGDGGEAGHVHQDAAGLNQG
ncbi:hypothetical protein D9M72_480190 [compost metagenome]